MSKAKDIIKTILLSLVITTCYNVFFDTGDQNVSEKLTRAKERSPERSPDETQPISSGGDDSATGEDDDGKNEYDDGTNEDDNEGEYDDTLNEDAPNEDDDNEGEYDDTLNEDALNEDDDEEGEYDDALNEDAPNEDNDNKNEYDDAPNEDTDDTKDTDIKSSNDAVDDGIDHSHDRQLWPSDPVCSSYTVGIPKSASGSWLLTAPRSGTDWTLYLVEAATGMCSSTMYLEKGKQPLGFLGYYVKPGTVTSVITKTHNYKHLSGRPNWPVVIVLRNPARSLVSLFNFEELKGLKNKSSRFTGSVGNKLYNTWHFHKSVRQNLKDWLEIYTYALKERERLHVVFYEYLRENPLEELRKILEFLGLNADEERLFCIARHLEGYRKGAQRKITPYNRQEQREIKRALLKIDRLLEDRGFPLTPNYKRFDN